MSPIERALRAIAEQGIGRYPSDRVLNVTSVVLLEEGIEQGALGGEVESVPFWTSLSLEQLAALQGVGSADDLDQISALWPVDDDPDPMLAHILEERSARRRRQP